MRLGNEESRNVEDRRSSGGLVGKGSLSIGTIVLALVAWYFGIDPSLVLNNARSPAPQSQQGVPLSSNPNEDPAAHLVSKVLRDTEKTWGDIFAQNGKTYAEPKLVMFRGATQTACGMGQTAMGPFYCPADRKVYIDLAFFNELTQRFRASGEFAQAYVIAHEVGHHVQNQLGISSQVRAMQSKTRNKAQINELSVRLELQADCFAGIWANHADASRQILEAGDVESALRAASAIGDDTLQKQAQGYAVPESFTHGTSEQRMSWFQRGLKTGDVAQCNTFK